MARQEGWIWALGTADKTPCLALKADVKISLGNGKLVPEKDIQRLA